MTDVIMHEVPTADAIAMADTEWWKGLPKEEVVRFQFFTAQVCMDFGEFQCMLADVLEHPVFTATLALHTGMLQREFLEKTGQEAPTLEEIQQTVRQYVQ